ncbi:sensor domain-containing diguanylate cyclase [Microvirga pudoricolor]|uniref:sensor domain-containing diguanylate cyclase n=1 Tax=Microvirga pudoricolor TaxID=2778729 RepID=UPI00194FC7FB|nr:sensor domain-containing diguanylate cyclase [Microvirga pudoricolor]MBM6593308.1 GGDEF domain-containing protein [Microvirga pudoricolor]
MVRRLSLRSQITILVGLLCFGLACALALSSAYIARERAIGRITQASTVAAQTLANILDQGMAERYREVRNIAQLLPLREIWNRDPAEIRPVLEQLKVSFPAYAWIGFARPDGTVHAATYRMLEGQSVAARPWFQDGLHGPAVGDVHEAKLLAGILGPSPDNEPFRFVDVAAPVHNRDGTLAGVLGAHLSWSWASEMRGDLLNQSRNPDQEIWILSGDGTVLLGPKTGTKPFTEPQVRAMLRQTSGAFEDTRDGQVFLTGYAVADGYRDYPGFNWIILSRQPKQVAFAYAQQIAATILALGFAVALMGILATSLIAAKLVKPLQILTDAADRIGRDPSVRAFPRVGGSREVARLASSLRSLMRRAGLAERRVLETEQRSQAAHAQHEKDLTALRSLAETDALSGLLNRRGFDLFSQDAVDQFQRYGRNFAVLMADIDFFKKVNDTYGHAAGDEAIRAIARTLSEHLRPTDKVARFGGEEFVVLIREIGQEGVLTVAQNLRRAVELQDIVSGEHRFSVTISIGGALIGPADRDVQDLIERADVALYGAKTSGRNRVVIDGLGPRLASSAA